MAKYKKMIQMNTKPGSVIVTAHSHILGRTSSWSGVTELSHDWSDTLCGRGFCQCSCNR